MCVNTYALHLETNIESVILAYKQLCNDLLYATLKRQALRVPRDIVCFLSRCSAHAVRLTLLGSSCSAHAAQPMAVLSPPPTPLSSQKTHTISSTQPPSDSLPSSLGNSSQNTQHAPPPPRRPADGLAPTMARDAAVDPELDPVPRR